MSQGIYPVPWGAGGGGEGATTPTFAEFWPKSFILAMNFWCCPPLLA